jgi:hypothetical protein
MTMSIMSCSEISLMTYALPFSDSNRFAKSKYELLSPEMRSARSLFKETPRFTIGNKTDELPRHLTRESRWASKSACGESDDSISATCRTESPKMPIRSRDTDENDESPAPNKKTFPAAPSVTTKRKVKGAASYPSSLSTTTNAFRQGKLPHAKSHIPTRYLLPKVPRKHHSETRRRRKFIDEALTIIVEQEGDVEQEGGGVGGCIDSKSCPSLTVW